MTVFGPFFWSMVDHIVPRRESVYDEFPTVSFVFVVLHALFINLFSLLYCPYLFIFLIFSLQI